MTDAGFHKPPNQIDWDTLVFVLLSIAIALFLMGVPHASRVSAHF